MAAAYVAGQFAGKTIAVVDDKSSYGKGLAQQFQTALHEKGINEVLADSVNAGERDFGSLVSRLKELRVDVLYFGGYKTEAGLIVRQMREQGLVTVLIGGDALVTEEFWSITGAAGEGTLMTFGPDPRLDPANKELVESFRAQSYEPEAYTLYSYAAIKIWAQAVAKAGVLETAAVEAALRSNEFASVLGPIGFDAKGDIKSAAGGSAGYVMYIWRDGKYIYAQ
jgi:branched-chain amino acid transport system substrate-binding protein